MFLTRSVGCNLFHVAIHNILLWYYCVASPPAALPTPVIYDLNMRGMMMNLTHLLCKDTTIKLWQADRVQERYKNSISYELGTISAGIQDTYKHMLETYKKYSNLTSFRLNKFSIEEMMNAYHTVKGDFNELRMEKNLYYEVLKRHSEREEKKKEEENKLINNIFKKFKNISRRVNVEEEKYKKNLRYSKWLKTWNNFVPEVEGIDVENFDPNNV